MSRGPRPVVEDTSVDHADDIRAITSLVEEIETGFNTNDPDLLVRPLAQNASVVDVMGRQHTGFDANAEASRNGLAGPLKDQYARYQLADIVFLRPDTAIAHKHAWATTPDGEPVEVGHAMVALYVFVKENDTWWVAARQNTLVPDQS